MPTIPELLSGNVTLEVLMYSVGNEISEQNQVEGVEMVKRLVGFFTGRILPGPSPWVVTGSVKP